MPRAFAEIAFTPSVQKMQRANGSEKMYAEFLSKDAAPGDRIGPMEMAFIAGIDGFFQATIGENGWPYVQFRGGKPGFLKVLDDSTIAYADFRGNRQYISTGNLIVDDRVSLILVDYPNRRRLKIWGHGKLQSASDDADLHEKLVDRNYRALVERVVLIKVVALDWNCPAHIPQRLTFEEMEPALLKFHEELDQLRTENAQMKKQLDQAGR